MQRRTAACVASEEPALFVERSATLVWAFDAEICVTILDASARAAETACRCVDCQSARCVEGAVNYR